MSCLWSSGSGAGLSRRTEWGHSGASPAKGHGAVQEHETSLMQGLEAERAELFSSGVSYLVLQINRARIFLVVPSQKRKSSGHKLKPQNSY